MIFTTLSLPTALASLGLCLVTGIWVGYRYALESQKMRAVIDHALDTVDIRAEDVALAPRAWSRNTVAGYADTALAPARDWNWDAELWWDKHGNGPCPCGNDHRGWVK